MPPSLTAPERPARRPTGSARSKVLDLIPVAVVVVVGTVGIVLRAQQGPRSSVHVILLSLVLAENVFALLVRGRHPLMTFVGVVATYALVDNEATTLLPVLVALFTVAMARDRHIVRVAAGVTALVVIATPVIHSDGSSLFLHTLLPLLGGGVAVGAGIEGRKRGFERWNFGGNSGRLGPPVGPNQKGGAG